jgi:hypothetical protein
MLKVKGRVHVALSSKLKNVSVGTIAPIVFYSVVGVIFLVLLPIANYPPHIGLTGFVSLIAAYGLFTKRWWALWLVVALFFVAATISLYTLYFTLLSNWLTSVGLIAYLLLSLYFMYYTYTRRK